MLSAFFTEMSAVALVSVPPRVTYLNTKMAPFNFHLRISPITHTSVPVSENCAPKCASRPSLCAVQTQVSLNTNVSSRVRFCDGRTDRHKHRYKLPVSDVPYEAHTNNHFLQISDHDMHTVTTALT